jgi:hypothetical protein
LVRCFFTIPVLILVIRFMGEAVYRISRGDNPSPFDLSILGWAGILPAAVFLGYYLLDAAASRIAPQAVNYVTRRRVAGLAAFLISVVVAHWTAEAAFLAYPLFFFALLALDALTEHPATVDSVYAPFRRNPLTRVLEHFLAPGWYTGTWFVLLLGVILTIANAVSPGLWRASASDGSQEVIGIIIGFVASALLPLAIMLLPRERSQQPIVTYCLLVIFMGVISATLIQFVDHGDIPALAWLGMVLPPLSTYAMLRADSFESPELVTILGILVVLTIVSITIIARKWNKIHLAMRRAQREDLTV